MYLLFLASIALLAPLVQAQPCPRAIAFGTNYQYRGQLHFICLQAPPINNLRPQLEVIEYLSQKTIFSNPVNEIDTNQLTSFVDDEGSLRILLAVPNRINGTSMYSLDRSGRPILETHTINTQFVNSMSIWRLALNLEWQLAIANQPDYSYLTNNQPGYINFRSSAPEPQPMISIHSWRSTYFDSYQIIYLHQDSQINKIEPMNINGQEFLIVAVESNANLADSKAKSIVYKLDFGDGDLNWIQFQQFDIKAAFDVRSFAITHQDSLQQDYYIAVLGQRQLSNATYQAGNDTESIPMDDKHSLVIYKYFGNQFVEIDSIHALSANRLDAITYGNGDSYVVMALLSQFNNQVDLYLFDGLDLWPIESPYNSINKAPNYPIGRRRRTVGLPIMQLFRAPSAEQAAAAAPPGDTTAKRTLSDHQQTVGMPVLAFASPSPSSAAGFDNDGGNGDKPISQPKPMYAIPIESVIKNKTNTYSKRNFAPDDLLYWCKGMIGDLLADSFEPDSQRILMTPRIDQRRPIELNGDLLIDGDLYVSNLLYVNRVFERVTFQSRNFSDSPLFTDPRMDYSDTFQAIQQAHSEIDELKVEIDQILVDDGSEQDIFRLTIFDKIVIECPNALNMDPRFQLRGPLAVGNICPHIDEIQTNFLNRRNIDDIQSRAYLTGRSSVIDRDVRFEHLVLKGDVNILGTLNGLQIGEIVFKVGPSYDPITGTKYFKNGMFSSSNLIVQGWNGRLINRQQVLVSTGEQRIESNLKFDQVIIDSAQTMPNMSSRIEKLNEIHLDSHLGQRAISTEDNHFEVPVEFDELILNGPVRFTKNSLLSSIDLVDLWHHAMFKQSIQNVSAPMDFSGDVHVSYGGNIIVDGKVNGFPFGYNDFVMRNRNITIINPVVFDDVDFKSLYIQPNNTLNDIPIQVNPGTGRHELAILYKHGDQVITADKILDEVRTGGLSNITGLINNHLNLNQLYDLITSGRPFRFKDIRLKGNDFQVAESAPFHVETINNFAAGDICNLANRVSEYPQTVYKKLRFNQPIIFKSLRCGSINGFNNLSNYFLTKFGNQHVAGTLRLLNGAIFNTSINIQSTFNDLNIAPLSRAIAQANSENRTGHKEVFGDFVIENLFAERINNLRLSNVFLARADNPQIVRAPMSFDHLDIESILTVGRNLVTNSFNGLNISDLITNTLQYDTPQIIYNHVELNNLVLLPGSNLITPSVNRQNLKQLFADAVLVDVPQQILAPKVFRNLVEFTNRVSIRHSIDGLSDYELRFNLLLQSDELIEGDLEFNNDVFVEKELEIQSGIINDIDISLFVNSMLYETRPGQNGLRILGNGSIRFKDVDAKNLVVGGTIQGIDLSREAIMAQENINGTYQQHLIEKQNMLNNLRLLNSGYGPGTTFWVKTNYANRPLIGSCYVQNCPRTTVQPPITGPMSPGYNTYQTPAPPPVYRVPQLLPAPVMQSFTQRPYVATQQFLNQSAGILLPMQQLLPQQQPLPQHQQLLLQQQQQQLLPQHQQLLLQQQQQPPQQHLQLPPFLPMPFSLVNTSLIKTTWVPNLNVLSPQTGVINPNTMVDQVVQIDDPIVFDPQYHEHASILQAKAISELSLRVNKYLSLTFYYEIVQKHPLLGPLLHAPSNPIVSEEGSTLLLLKGTGRPGEPCRQINQSVAIMARQRNRKPIAVFTQSSLIQGTSNPTIVESAVAGSNHYLFILDTHPTVGLRMMSRVMVHLWNAAMGFYELKEELEIDGYPTGMKAFVVNSAACIALVNHKLIYGNNSGTPILLCQRAPGLPFDLKLIVPIANVFDLDVVVQPRSTTVIIAALSQQITEQIGDLNVILYDVLSRSTEYIASRRTAKPLRLHFIRNIYPQISGVLQLVVSEAITSNDDAQAITRIFSLRTLPGPSERYGVPGKIRFYESQLFRDNQIYDIQSVLLYEGSSLLFLQSAYSISIYAPLNAANRIDCDTQYSLAQKVPTRGANKFLVFNDSLGRNNTNSGGLFGHFLVLSKDDCEQQQYSTLILRSKFR